MNSNSFVEYSKEDLEREKKHIFEEEKKDFLNSLYDLFQKFDTEINNDEFNKNDSYIIIITTLLILIEDKKFISVDEVDQKLNDFTTYKTFKSKNSSMKLIQNASTNLKKTDHNLYGGSGYLTLALLGIAIASSLVQSVYSAEGVTAKGLEYNNMKNQLTTYGTDMARAQTFNCALENYGGSCTVNSQLTTKGQSSAIGIINVLEKTHTPEIVAQNIDNSLKEKPTLTLAQYEGSSHHVGTSPYGNFNEYIINDWGDSLQIMTKQASIIHSNWATSTNAAPDDICMFYSSFNYKPAGGHAFNTLSRNVNGVIKLGAVDSNDYTNIVEIINGKAVPGKAVTNGWIRVQKGFFTSAEEKRLGSAVIITQNPYLSVYDRYAGKADRSTTPGSKPVKFSMKLENNSVGKSANFPTSPTGDLAIMQFSVSSFEKYVQVKDNIDGITADYFSAIKQYPGSTAQDYNINYNCVGSSCPIFVHKGGKTKKNKRSKKSNKKRSNKKRSNKKRFKKLC